MNRRDFDADVIAMEACSYNAIGAKSIVINPAEIGHCVWVHLEPNICRMKYISAEEIGSDVVLHDGAVERDNNTWLKIFSDELNLEVGYHLYRFKFLDCSMKLHVYQYIAYTIQTPDAPKPYLYMKRQETQ